jgi:hypothetical protein
MKSRLTLPLWLHLTGFVIAFFGWTGMTYFVDGPRTHAGLAEAALGGCIFAVVMALFDAASWATAKFKHK